jgi:hypothetical protein
MPTSAGLRPGAKFSRTCCETSPSVSIAAVVRLMLLGAARCGTVFSDQHSPFRWSGSPGRSSEGRRLTRHALAYGIPATQGPHARSTSRTTTGERWVSIANREERTVRRIRSTTSVRAAESVRRLGHRHLAEQIRSAQADGEHCSKFRLAKPRTEQVAQPSR